MTTTTTIDQTKLLHQFVGDLGATVQAAGVVLGDKLGLYRALADGGAATPAELAARTGTHERYVAEWLAGQAAGGYVTYADGVYSLSPEQAFALADESSPAFVPGAFQLACASSVTSRGSLRRSAPVRAWAGTSTGRTSSPVASASSGRVMRRTSSARGSRRWTASGRS